MNQKRKEKWRNKMHTRQGNLEIMDPEAAWSEYEEENYREAS